MNFKVCLEIRIRQAIHIFLDHSSRKFPYLYFELLPVQRHMHRLL